jgi:hypothetical protein
VDAAPVVALVVVESAVAPLPDTEPLPRAVAGAVTEVAPTVAALLCVVPPVTVAPPLPAVAVLETDGVTVCLMVPLVPSSHSLMQLRWVVANVVVRPPVASLLATVSLVLMRVAPVRLRLSALG